MSHKTALITGASSGIGKAFAEELAQKSYDLIIIARTTEALNNIKNDLETKHGISVKVITQDLTLPNACEDIYGQLKQENIIVDLLINNAGFGDYGLFCDRPLDKQLKMIQLNISALVTLTHLFLQDMRERKEGDIINVGSIAGYQPLPYLSVYAATKAFVLSFSEALWAENKEFGITILALCPGPTESNFGEVAEFELNQNSDDMSLAKAEDVVKDALDALSQKKSNSVTGGLVNQIIVNLPRFLPRELLLKAVEKQFKKNK
ncbi:SDR family NAD(P)-dependent oxidoreductase [Cyanobacterium sp. IPPAS B-1200]|uniref:SDR family NAD(P)-dependent oxidoreductase n=1 Tax=Cyanobacterium sp. IPPAS B-1200 TaxID=1562720 RepID=UPI00085276A7|nr:SDR family oxidoreductase [Cyanobacterium sp. IPPAS B-1200]OEJ80115.1 oxidoreductase [Cyanobacterium sp. IPPAS B-1200]